MESQSFCWVHIGMEAAQPAVIIGEQQMSAGYAVVQGFVRDGWTYVPEEYPGALEKVTRGEEMLWLQLPGAIDGVLLSESLENVKIMLAATPSISVTSTAHTPFPEWSVSCSQAKATAA